MKAIGKGAERAAEMFVEAHLFNVAGRGSEDYTPANPNRYNRLGPLKCARSPHWPVDSVAAVDSFLS